MMIHTVFLIILHLHLSFGVNSQGHLKILEGDSIYEQKTHFERGKNIVIIDVPAHNSIVHSRTIIDFNSVILNNIL